jgi:deferrochelatase/peroxidase EfeB
MALLVDVSIHRIIRRSTAYGAPYDPNPASKHDDEVAYGLYPVSIGAKRWPSPSSCNRN